MLVYFHITISGAEGVDYVNEHTQGVGQTQVCVGALHTLQVPHGPNVCETKKQSGVTVFNLVPKEWIM